MEDGEIKIGRQRPPRRGESNLESVKLISALLAGTVTLNLPHRFARLDLFARMLRVIRNIRVIRVIMVIRVIRVIEVIRITWVIRGIRVTRLLGL